MWLHSHQEQGVKRRWPTGASLGQSCCAGGSIPTALRWNEPGSELVDSCSGLQGSKLFWPTRDGEWRWAGNRAGGDSTRGSEDNAGLAGEMSHSLIR